MDTRDTIVAVSSPTSQAGVLVRISGPETQKVLQQFFSPSPPQPVQGLYTGTIAIDSELNLDAVVYQFISPHSYTGQDLAEIHIFANPAVTKMLLTNLLGCGLRMAGPGEFTARGYLNGKMDLAQAEAVNEIIVSSNKFQLAAAEKLLAGKLAQTTRKICDEIMDCLSRIELGMDFSGEDIEFITAEQAIEKLETIKAQLEQLLTANISYESIIDLPSVAIAGPPNAGKSTLLNKMLGKQRSIVSEIRKTTRDVLSGELELQHCRCVLFDCAGLIVKPTGILDRLAQQAAAEAIRNSWLVIFCVDVSKADWAEDLAVCKLIDTDMLMPVATKADLLGKKALAKRLDELNKLFDCDFFAISAETGLGLQKLIEQIDKKIIELTTSNASKGQPFDTGSAVALTARHKQAVTDAVDSITEAIVELKAGSDEVTAMMLRAAYQTALNASDKAKK